LVSPENLPSMTMIMDASATAIYGSRASNGVIIITTKAGAKGKPQVNFTMNGYVNTTRKYLDMMNGNEFRNFITQEYGEGSLQAGQLGNYTTDWQKALTHTTFSSDYSLSIGGTAGWLPYRVAVAYTDNNGIIRNTDMNRLTASVNLTPKFFNDLLSVNANIKGAYITNSYGANTLDAAARMDPTQPIRDMENGSPLFGYYTSYVNGGILAGPDAAGETIDSTTSPLNPIADNEAAVSKGTAYQSVGNLQLDLKMPFLTDLRANLNLGYDYQHGENYSNFFINTPKAWNNGYTVLDNGNRINIKDGGVSRKYEFQTRVNLLLDFYLNYNHAFESINSTLDVTAGYSWQKFHNKRRDYSRVYQVVNPENEKYLGNQADPTNVTIQPHQLVSFFGRVNFTLLDKYLVTATVRRDGTSRFSKDNRWGTFPSVALGWKLLEENFMESARDYMNELKIRAGYGVTGQQDLGDDYLFPYLPVYTQWTGGGAVYPSITGQPSTGTYPFYAQSYNANLKWEETHTWNAGIDFGFLNNRILGSIDFYKRKTKDLLTQSPYAAGSNLTNKGPMNLGDLENTGIEFNITARPIVTKDFRWTSAFNVAWNKNKITYLADGADTMANDYQIHQVGNPAFSFY
ncbi:MAG: SusC/RagA family TonB-linked outer membrane protein, partial [Duncaniella sp.]|nr:SusC/RagA family TonB-linked outer membrane protein [Duncaniella sp.]